MSEFELTLNNITYKCTKGYAFYRNISRGAYGRAKETKGGITFSTTINLINATHSANNI